MNVYKIIVVGLVILLSQGCSSTNKDSASNTDENMLKPLSEGYSVIFYELDNYALVYLDDQLICDSREKVSEQSDQFLLNLNPFISESSPRLKVEIYNIDCGSCQVNNYELVYEIFKDGEGLEYVSEYSNHQHSPLGLSLTREHNLFELE